MKKWPTTRDALKKARATIDGPGDVVKVPGDTGAENTDTSHASTSEPDTEQNGDDTVPVGKKKKKD